MRHYTEAERPGNDDDDDDDDDDDVIDVEHDGNDTGRKNLTSGVRSDDDDDGNDDDDDDDDNDDDDNNKCLIHFCDNNSSGDLLTDLEAGWSREGGRKTCKLGVCMKT